MDAVWLVDRADELPPLVMLFDPERGLSHVTSDGVVWRASDRPHREIMRGGYAERVTEAEARMVFGQLPDDAADDAVSTAS